MVKIAHQNTCVIFVNSSLNNSNWNKITESFIKKFHIWNRVGLSLRSQKTFINQPLSKHWYIVQICTIRKSTIQICTIRQEIEKRIYNLLQKNKKIRLPRHLDIPWTF